MAQDKNLLVEDDEDLEKDQEYVVVEEPIKEDSAASDDEDDEDDEERPAKTSEDEDADSDDEREVIRARRREEKKERKERREKAIGRDKVELNFLRQRNDELERRMVTLETNTQRSTLNDTDRQLQEAIREAEQAELIIAKAVEAGNGEDVTKALRYRDQAIAKAQQLNGIKQQQQQYQAPNPTPGIDSAVAHYAQEFMDQNKWYDPSGKDEDSAIVMAIDNRLVQEGYDPRSEEYWDELQHRVERRMPDKFAKQERQARKPQGGPAVGSGREHAPSSTRKEIYISPQRKEAMIEAGVWEDPVLRQRYIKRYAEYDKLNKN